MANPPGLLTVAAGAAAGSGGAAALDINSTDERGEVTITTGASGAAAGLLATITFNGSWQGYPLGQYAFLAILGTNVAAAQLGTLSAMWANGNTQLLIYCTGTPAASTAYSINYAVKG